MVDSRNVLEICSWILHLYGKTLGTKYPMMQRHIPEQSDTSTTAMVNSKNCIIFVTYNLKNHTIKSSFCGTKGLNKLKTMQQTINSTL